MMRHRRQPHLAGPCIGTDRVGLNRTATRASRGAGRRHRQAIYDPAEAKKASDVGAVHTEEVTLLHLVDQEATDDRYHLQRRLL